MVKTVLDEATRLAEVVNSWNEFARLMFDRQTGFVAKTYPNLIDRQKFFDSKEFKECMDVFEGLIRKFGVLDR